MLILVTFIERRVEVSFLNYVIGQVDTYYIYYYLCLGSYINHKQFQCPSYMQLNIAGIIVRR